MEVCGAKYCDYDACNPKLFINDMIEFPLTSQPSQIDCYELLLSLLHRDGLQCPNGHSLDDAKIHRRKREPIIDYRCKICGRCFNAFTGTVLQGTKLDVCQIVQCIDGLLRNVSISSLAEKIGVDYKGLAKRCKKIKVLVLEYKKKRTLDWCAILSKIDRWELMDDIQSGDEKKLIVHVKYCGRYSLQIKKYTQMDPLTHKKTAKKYTNVEKIG